MRNSIHGQRGVTLTGLIMMSVLFGAAALVAMRLFPLYNEKMKVDFALEKVIKDSAASANTKGDLVKAIMKQFEVSDVDRWSTAEFTKLLQIVRDPDTDKRLMRLEYEIRNELCCSLDIVLNYFSELEIPRGQTD